MRGVRPDFDHAACDPRAITCGAQRPGVDHAWSPQLAALCSHRLRSRKPSPSTVAWSEPSCTAALADRSISWTEPCDRRPTRARSRNDLAVASGGWHTCSMQAFLAALVGGVLTIAGGLTAVLVTGRGVRSQWRKDTQLKVSTDVLSALQTRVSRINDLAYLADKESDEGKSAWSTQVAAVTGWNNSRHAALLVSPPEVAAMLQKLDKQTDLLLQQAMSKEWTLVEFRKQRDSLGRLAATYIDAMRAETGWAPLRLKSLWTWDQTVEPPNVASSPNQVSASDT